MKKELCSVAAFGGGQLGNCLVSKDEVDCIFLKGKGYAINQNLIGYKSTPVCGLLLNKK